MRCYRLHTYRYLCVITALLLVSLSPGVLVAEEIQFFGDIQLSRGIEAMIAHEGQDAPLKGVSALFRRGSINIANLEGAVGNASDCSAHHEPCFAIRSSAMDLLDPFDVVNLANNHSLDLGLPGQRATSRALTKRGIIPLGSESSYHIIRLKEGDVGIIALTDVVNSLEDRNRFEAPDGQRVLETIRMLKAKTTLVAVYIHWGKELDSLPTDRMKEIANAFIRAGADLIVGHHSHVIGEVDCLGGKPVVYSLGNFLFDQKYEDTKTGGVLRCAISADDHLRCGFITVGAPMHSFGPVILRDNLLQKRANDLLSACAPTVTRTWTDVFSRNGNMESVSLVKKERAPGKYQIVISGPKTGKKVLSETAMPIQSLQPVDLNRDGIKEVILLQNVYSSLDEEIGKRVYVYSFAKGMRALWRGSALSRPLLDAAFIQEPTTQEPVLLALHSTDSFLLRDKTKKGRIIMSYRWNGFGFTGIKEKQISDSADFFSINKKLVWLHDCNGATVESLSQAAVMAPISD